MASCWTRQPVRAQRTGKAMQLHFAKVFRVEGAVHLRKYALRQHDLPTPGVLAKATREIRHGPDRGVIDPALEADGADGRKALVDADCQPEIDTALLPF